MFSRDDLLDILIEECADIIQAATKCKRFGWERDYPGCGVNRTAVAREIGDFKGVVAAIMTEFDADDCAVMNIAARTKMERHAAETTTTTTRRGCHDRRRPSNT